MSWAVKAKRYKTACFKHPGPHGCGYCGAWLTFDTATVDHVTPRSQGGSNSRSNLALACQRCNTEKSLAESRGVKGERWVPPKERAYSRRIPK